MNTFPKNVSILFPVVLEPCLSGDDADSDVPAIRFNEPDNLNVCQLITPLASHFYHCGTVRHKAGYDCDVVLLPLQMMVEHLKMLSQKETPEQPLKKRLLKSCQRWSRMNANFVRLTFTRRLQNFSIEQQIWGHENASYSPELHPLARKLTDGRCDFCYHNSEHNLLILLDNNPENPADINPGKVCPLCACSRYLNRLGANDGVMVYLPELSPADISHLLRSVVVARLHGDERQKQGAKSILHWLAAHRKETEAFWGTSHPGEFGQALMQAPEHLREDLQQRLKHIALIPNPDLISSNIRPASAAPETWLSLLNQYRSQR